MGLRLGQPTQAEIDAIAAHLRPGEQRAVGGGIYLRVDSTGRRRFQIRIREAGTRSRNGGQTFDTWADADIERRRRVELKQQRGGQRLKAQLRSRMPLEEYTWGVWWPFVCEYAEPITQRDYARVIRHDVLPYWKSWRLDDIGVDDVEAFARQLRSVKRFRTGSRIGEIPEAACRRALEMLSHVLNDAVDREVLERNPVVAFRRMEKKRNRRLPPSHPPVRRRFVQDPLTVERIRLAMRGRGPWQQYGRAIVSLAAWEGLRPNEIVALTHECWRDDHGPRSHIYISRGVKESGCGLTERDTKTHRDREVELWPVVAEELEAIYIRQGKPQGSALVFSNRCEGYIRWDNWRHRNWYEALHRAGISDAPIPSARGAFDPYSLRHTFATLMFHALTSNGRRYSPLAVARQLGCSIETLFRVYTDVLEDVTESVRGATVDEIIREARRACEMGCSEEEPGLKRLGYPTEWVQDAANQVTCCRACNEFLNAYRISDPPPATLEEFFDLRDRHFRAKRRWVQARHATERAWYHAAFPPPAGNPPKA